MRVSTPWLECRSALGYIGRTHPATIASSTNIVGAPLVLTAYNAVSCHCVDEAEPSSFPLDADDLASPGLPLSPL